MHKMDMSRKEALLSRLREAMAAQEELLWAVGEVSKALHEPEVDRSAIKETLAHIEIILEDLRKGYHQIGEELGR